MTFLEKLNKAVDKNNSLVCVGLDSDFDKLPVDVKKTKQPQFEFNKAIIDATASLVCAYKPNSAFYEALGPSGIEQLQQTLQYIHKAYPEIPIIVDAKRADIGSTNNGYVKFIFEYLEADAVTLNPYLGQEALEPFLGYKEKGLIILCHTTNEGAAEFQNLKVDGKLLYQHIAESINNNWNTNSNCLLVAGANFPEEMKEIRKIVGDDMVLLVPGVGAQGADIEQIVKAGKNSSGKGLIINSSRGIIFASSGKDFAEAARAETQKLRDEINKYRS